MRGRSTMPKVKADLSVRGPELRRIYLGEYPDFGIPEPHLDALSHRGIASITRQEFFTNERALHRSFGPS